jgi:predicted flap endonuclease-1-like 5' DNA nuclease
LLGLVVVAASVGWVLLRRRTGAALPALAPTAPPPATDGTPATGEAPDALATDAGLTPEPAAPAPEPAATPAPDTLATDAGLTPADPATTAEPAAPEPAVVASAGVTDDTVVLPRVVDPDAPAPTGTDDLRAIRGIGPAIERTLHELGITTYRQIAELHGEQLEAVRNRLEAFSARIEREDWAGQARELHRQKYGD